MSQPILLRRRLAIFAAAASVSAVLVACSNIETPSSGGASSTVAASSSTVGSSSTTATGLSTASEPELTTVDGRSIVVPPGITFPENTKIKLSSPGQLILNAPAPAELLDYFRTGLPAAGYLIVDDLGEVLNFSGKGWTGTVSATGEDTVISYKQSSSSTTAAPSTGSDLALDPELIDVDGRSIVVPPGINFPANTKIKASSDGYVTLNAPAPAALLDYFRTSLPGAGYLIVDDLGEVLNFSGKGWFGTVATTTDETTISFNL